MPKIWKTKRAPKRKYSQEVMNEALERVKKGEMSCRSAAKLYNIPRATMHDKITHKSPLVCKSGPNPCLTPEEETAIAKWTIHMDRLGFGPTKNDVREVVKQILDKDGRRTPFKDNRPGDAWFRSCRSRNPGFICKKEQPNLKKVDVPPSMMDTWFDGFVEYLEEIKAQAILNEPARLYKCKESCFEYDDVNGPRKLKEDKAAKTSKLKRLEDTRVTTLLAVSADGCIPPPLVVMPGKKVLRPCLGKDGSPHGAIIARTKTGVMDSSAFLKFLRTIFHPFLIKKKVPRPVLLFVNEHSKNQSIEVSSFCNERDILLYQGPPHAVHECQLSKLFVAECLNVDWGYVENPGCHVTKKSLPSIIFEAWEKLKGKPSIGINEFKAIGVYPFTRVYNPTMSSPSTLQKMSSRSTSSTQSTSKESWPMVSDVTTTGGSAAQSFADETAAAIGSLASTDDAIVIVPGRQPVRVSPATTTLLARVVGALEENGNITFHIEKPHQDNSVKSSQVTGAGKKKREVPEELWEEFQRFMAKKKEKKEQKKAMKKKELKKKALKVKQLKKARKDKVLKVALIKPKGKKRKPADELDDGKSVETEQEKKRAGKAKTKTLPRKDSTDDSSESSDDTDSSSESEESDGDNICIECDEGGDMSGWVGCSYCTSWIHLDCSELYGLTLDEVKLIPYKCKYCR